MLSLCALAILLQLGWPAAHALHVRFERRVPAAAEHSQDVEHHDHDNGDQNQDQSVFDEALTFFAGHVQHDDYSSIIG